MDSVTNPSSADRLPVSKDAFQNVTQRVFIPSVSYSNEKTEDPAFSSAITTTTDSSTVTNGKTLVSSESSPLVHGRRRIASAFFVYLVCGWADSVTGTLLPKFKEDLGMNYTESSLIFVLGAIGYTIGTVAIEPFMNILGRFDISSQDRAYFPSLPLSFHRLFGRGVPKVVGYSPSQARSFLLVTASLFNIIFLIIIGTSANFASALLAFTCSTFARAFFTGSLNAYVNAQPKVSLGQLHGFWAVGGLMSPVVCQTLISRGIPWRDFYLMTLVLAGLNTFFVLYAYYPTQSEFHQDRERAAGLRSELPKPSTQHPSKSYSEGEDSLRKAIRDYCVWAFSLFMGLYAGSETVTQGFVVVFLLGQRAANPHTVGYADTGFWAGEAISRIGFGFFYLRMSFRTVKYVLYFNLGYHSVLALALHVLVWQIPSIVADNIFTAMIGLVYGPIFPLGIALATRILPKEIHMTSMAIMSTVANLGNAIFPFITGLLANKVGVQSYNYVLVAQGVVMVVLWGILPSQTTPRNR